MSKAQHSSASPLWGTARTLVDLSRVVLGGDPDLDPFSDPEWNAIVGAKRILTKRDNAYRCSWFDGSPPAEYILRGEATSAVAKKPRKGIVNAPGDPRGVLVKDAWTLTEWHHRMYWLGGGVIWIAFNIGQLQTTQQAAAPRCLLHPDFLRCIPRSRVAFVERVKRGKEPRSAAPPHASAIVLLPAHGSDGDEQRELFRVVAGRLGEVF